MPSTEALSYSSRLLRVEETPVEMCPAATAAPRRA